MSYDIVTQHESSMITNTPPHEFEPPRNLLAVVRANGNHFAVDFDYGEGNYSPHETYEDARAEAGRLWALGWAGRIHDFVAQEADARGLREAEMLDAAIREAWSSIKAARAA